MSAEKAKKILICRCHWQTNAHRAGAQRTDDVAHRMIPPSVTTLDHLLPPALKSGICIFIVSGKWPELARTVSIHYPLAVAAKECVLFVNDEPQRRLALFRPRHASSGRVRFRRFSNCYCHSVLYSCPWTRTRSRLTCPAWCSSTDKTTCGVSRRPPQLNEDIRTDAVVIYGVALRAHLHGCARQWIASSFGNHFRNAINPKLIES